MTDREMLELAAKAAGIGIWWDFIDGEDVCTKDGGGDWNPLDNDGAALQLAIKLGMSIHIIARHTISEVFLKGVDWVNEPHNGDPYAATRHAIVRAAAEIGKGMP